MLAKINAAEVDRSRLLVASMEAMMTRKEAEYASSPAILDRYRAVGRPPLAQARALLEKLRRRLGAQNDRFQADYEALSFAGRKLLDRVCAIHA
jgi:hypothetical protein